VTWTVIIKPSAIKEIAALDIAVFKRVKAAITQLADNPRPRGTTKLKQRSRDSWRIRVGNWRVILKIDDATHTVHVLHVVHRREAYR